MRVRKISDNKTIVYHYDQGGRVISENDGDGNLLTDYIYLHGKLVVKVIDDAFIPPAAPSDLTATAVSYSDIDLSWADNSDNETGFKIERKIEGGTYSEIGTVGTDVTTYPDTGLTPEMTYYYRVSAYNAGGDSNYSNEASATTPLNPPVAPTGLTATAVSSDQIDLSWTDNSDNEAGFKIERKIEGGTYSEIGTVGANVMTYPDTGLIGNTTYYYRVKAYNIVDESSYSNEASATTFLNAPTGLTATAISSSQIDLSWTDNSDNETGFKIERKTGAGGTYSEIAIVGAGVTTYPDTGLTENTTYYYRVKAYNIIGESSYSNEASVTTWPTTPPTAPSNLTATSVSVSQIDLLWTDNSDNEAGFKIERKIEGGSYSEIGTVGANVTSYPDTDLIGNRTYYYRVKAYNIVDESSYSNEASATTFILNTPTDLTATAVSFGQIDLSWVDNSDNETGFYIERKIEGGTYSEIDTVGADVTSYPDTGLIFETTYYYRVKAFNIIGESDYSNEADTTTLANWQIQIVDSIGNVGTYASLALDSNGNPHISYYDYTNRDLKYAYWNGAAWEIQTVDSIGGAYTSLALDSTGNPHISYYDGNLKYAKWNGASWDIQVVDNSNSGQDVGSYTSLALGSTGNPHISYLREYESAGFDNCDLKYAYWNGMSWDIQTVTWAGGNCNYSTSLALDSSGNQHISYSYVYRLNFRDYFDFKYAYWNGISWEIQTVDSTGKSAYTSLALDSSDNPHISYSDDTNRNLKYAYWNGVSWDIQTVDTDGSVGLSTSLALDASNNPHISYYDYTNDDLKYAYWNGTSWKILPVDTTGIVGQYTSLALDSSGNPHISYYDYTNGDLKYATKIPPPLPKNISVSPASHNFGSVSIGSTSTAQTFNITNTGDVDLVIGAITLTGTDASEFSIKNDTCSGQTIAPSLDCIVDVVFSPISEGAKNGDLSISSNDPDAPILNVPFIGTGVRIIPDIKANGSDGPVTIAQGDDLIVTVSLDPAASDGDPADWWVLADTPSGWYHYDASSDFWRSDIVVTYQEPLFNLSPLEVMNTTGLSTGFYTFYFGVDMIVNGSLDMDQLYSDSLEVNILLLTQITTDPSDQRNPAISGDYIVWHDFRNGNYDIYMYEISTGIETRITTDSETQRNPAISGNRIVWRDFRNGNYDIYMHEISTGIEIRITADPFNQEGLAISGDYIVWQDRRNGNDDIYMYEISTGIETRITTDPSYQGNSAISGDHIVWTDDRNGIYDIYMYEISTGTETRITTDSLTQWFPAISGDRIVWEDFRNRNYDIYMYEISTGIESRITADPSTQEYQYPAISGDYIVWQDYRNGNYDIYMYDITTGIETQITADPSYQMYPAISGNRIVWMDNRNGNWDIFMYEGGW